MVDLAEVGEIHPTPPPRPLKDEGRRRPRRRPQGPGKKKERGPSESPAEDTGAEPDQGSNDSEPPFIDEYV